MTSSSSHQGLGAGVSLARGCIDAERRVGPGAPSASSKLANARESFFVWMKTYGKGLKGLHVLFNSKLIEMGIALVNFVLSGTITSYSDVPSFERAIKREVPGFTHIKSDSVRKIAVR